MSIQSLHLKGMIPYSFLWSMSFLVMGELRILTATFGFGRRIVLPFCCVVNEATLEAIDLYKVMPCRRENLDACFIWA